MSGIVQLHFCALQDVFYAQGYILQKEERTDLISDESIFFYLEMLAAKVSVSKKFIEDYEKRKTEPEKDEKRWQMLKDVYNNDGTFLNSDIAYESYPGASRIRLLIQSNFISNKSIFFAWAERERDNEKALISFIQERNITHRVITVIVIKYLMPNEISGEHFFRVHNVFVASLLKRKGTKRPLSEISQ